MSVYALEIADDVEVDGARLDRFRPAAAQARKMAFGGVLLEKPRRGLVGIEAARQRHVASREHVEREAHGLLDPCMKGADFAKALGRERYLLADLLGGKLH
jgi:hypothetical protein